MAQNDRCSYLVVFMGQESGNGLATCPWLKISHEVAVKLSARAAMSSKNWTAVEDSLPG